MLDTTTYRVDSHISTYCLSHQPIIIHAIAGDTKEILVQEFISDVPIPIYKPIDPIKLSKELNSSGVTVLALEGGGRGPSFHEGEEISAAFLLEKLLGALTEDQLNYAVRKKLNALRANNSKNQSGYAYHNEIVSLSNNWVGHFPDVVIGLGYGQIANVKSTIIGVEPDCVEYLEIDKQECILGHSGLLHNHLSHEESLDPVSFTVKAAILHKEPHVPVTINWTPVSISGVTANETTESPLFTSVSCMGFRVQGYMGLVNQREYPVSGIIVVQISVDNGSWRSIAGLRWHFKEDQHLPVEKSFDVFLAYDPQVHTYKFRGYLLVDSDEEYNRLLTGYINVDTVTQVGLGTVLSNDLCVTWTAKE